MEGRPLASQRALAVVPLSFGAQLKRLRKAAGITQVQLALRAGYAPVTISKVERGERIPPPATFEQLAHALGLNVAERTTLEAAYRRTCDRRAQHESRQAEPAPASPVSLSPPLSPSLDIAGRSGRPRLVGLPFLPVPLLGREEAMANLTALLRGNDVQVVTVTGPSGVGKTRLAQQAAVELVKQFRDGVCYVSLAPLAAWQTVASTIAQRLGLSDVSSQTAEQRVCDYLTDKHLLLVLDNFEHVLPAATLVSALRETCPAVKVLATSRTRLHLSAERRFPLPPLALVDPQHLPALAELAQCPAVALFMQRAQAVEPDFQLTHTNAPAVAAICARLDGLPLAIELAAANVEFLPPEALLAHFSSCLALLTDGPRDLEPRQRTMRAAIAWSEDLLGPEARTLFRRLAVFAGGCTLEAAEAVCAAPEGAEPLGSGVLETLGVLLGQNLLQREHEQNGKLRFGMLQVIREYALERLEASDGGKEAKALRRAHLATYLSLAEQSLPHLDSSDAGTWLAQLEAERDNLRAALGWARDCGAAGQRKPLHLGLRLAAALGPFWFLQRNHLEGRRWLDALLELIAGPSGVTTSPPAEEGEDPTLQAPLMWALLYDAMFVTKAEDMVRAEALFAAGLAAARACGNVRAMVMALHGRGDATAHAGDVARGLALVQEALGLARQSGNGYALLNVLTGYSYLLLVFTREDDQAIALAEEARALARQAGDIRNETYAGYLLALSALRRDQVPLAGRLAREALLSSQQRGVTYSAPFGLEALALVAGRAGHGERAGRLLGAARVVREREATVFSPAEHAMFDELLAPVRAATDLDSWTAAYEAGRAVSLESAIAEALGEDE